ncbi:hypothetical protein QOZ99_000825 [Angulomicrobium amanitiforme]|uniref:Uncharacterized protein n=1 Tax=Ancylobacter amanitiformis TaxID=217069 RepID=A0ABU0LML0_9HYPH|nr:hypothetical protein [Ancylobacter amanitiformis]
MAEGNSMSLVTRFAAVCPVVAPASGGAPARPVPLRSRAD